jgi:transcriptional regulator GlxA family with amidase domain
MAETKIAILLFDKFAALDVVGPYEVLSRMPESKVYMAAVKPGFYKDPNGLQIGADYALQDIAHPDILLIPGGFGIDAILNDSTSQWTVSVCSGALLLAASGILKGGRATTHWNRKAQLAQYGVAIENARYVKKGKIITAAGVSAGIDMALYLLSLAVNENCAKAIQLGIEYDPKPPFDCGSPEKAPQALLDRLRK